MLLIKTSRTSSKLNLFLLSISMDVQFSVFIFDILTFNPIPIITFSELFSRRIPQIFFSDTKRSLGHFNFESIPKILSVFKTANPVSNDSKEEKKFGLSITEIHNPPSGDSHFLFSLPLPLLCFFANIIVKFSHFEAIFFAYSFVDSTVSSHIIFIFAWNT